MVEDEQAQSPETVSAFFVEHVGMEVWKDTPLAEQLGGPNAMVLQFRGTMGSMKAHADHWDVTMWASVDTPPTLLSVQNAAEVIGCLFEAAAATDRADTLSALVDQVRARLRDSR